jgi:hypothetical protein
MKNKAKPLGTILPTKKDLEINERCFQDLKTEQNRIANGSDILKEAEKVEVGGETRYYIGNKYAIVGRNKKIMWFEVREDGDYPIK